MGVSCWLVIGRRSLASPSPDALPLLNIISSLFWNDVQIFRAQMDNFISTTSGCFAIRRKYQKDQLGLFMIELRWKVLTLWHTTEFFHKYFIKNSALIVWKIAINSCESLSPQNLEQEFSAVNFMKRIFDHFFGARGGAEASAKSLAHHINPSFHCFEMQMFCSNGNNSWNKRWKFFLSFCSLRSLLHLR